MSHTTGDWKAIKEDHGYYIETVVEGKRLFIANISSTTEASKDNAKLIAAAPQLLSACQKMIHFLGKFYSLYEEESYEITEIKKMTKVVAFAIAKAQGI